MKLFFAPQTRSITALWMLLEAGAPYELVRVNIRAPGHPSAEFRQINPMGKVPALQDGGLGFGETSAILLYIADKFPQAKLAPAPTDPNRGRFLQWLMYPPTTIEPAMMEKRRGAEPMTTASGWLTPVTVAFWIRVSAGTVAGRPSSRTVRVFRVGLAMVSASPSCLTVSTNSAVLTAGGGTRTSQYIASGRGSLIWALRSDRSTIRNGDGRGRCGGRVAGLAASLSSD